MGMRYDANLDRFVSDSQPAQTSQSQGQPQKKKRNFWLDQLSTVGSIGGGIAGSFVTPILGTGVGAAVGGGLGEAIENILDPEGGNWGNVAKEAALSGVMGAGPIKLLKGAGAGAKALATGADDIAGAASKAATTSLLANRASSAAGKLTKGGSGLKVGTGVGDVNELDEVAKLFQRHKIVGTPEGQLRKIDSTMTKLGAEVDAMLAKKPVPAQGVATRIQQMIDDPTQFTDITLGDKGRQFLQSYIDEASKFTDARELNSLITKINPTARRAYNKSLAGTSLTAKEEAALAFKNAGDDVLQQIAPAIRNTKKEMALLFKYNPQVAKFSETGFNLPFMGKLTKGVAAPARYAQSTAGTMLAGQGRAGMGNQGLRGALGIGARLGATGLAKSPQESMSSGGLEDALLSAESMNNPMIQNTTDPTNMNTMMPANSSTIMDSQYQNAGDMSSSSPFSPDNVENNIQHILSNGGDLKDVKEYLSIVQAIQSFKPKETESKPLTGEARNRALKAQSGLRSLDTLESTLQSDAGAFQRQALPNPFGITARLTGTTDVRAATDNVVDIIARMRSGAAITDSEAARFARLLPQPGDSKESALMKLQNVRAELESYMQPDSGGNSLEDALMAYGGQQQYGY